MLLVELATLPLAGGGWLPISDAPCLGVGLKPLTILQEPVPALLELLWTSPLREAFCTHCCVFIDLPQKNPLSRSLCSSLITLSDCSYRKPHPLAATSTPVSAVPGAGIKNDHSGLDGRRSYPRVPFFVCVDLLRPN